MGLVFSEETQERAPSSPSALRHGRMTPGLLPLSLGSPASQTVAINVCCSGTAAVICHSHSNGLEHGHLKKQENMTHNLREQTEQ